MPRIRAIDGKFMRNIKGAFVQAKCDIVFSILSFYIFTRYRKVYKRHCKKSERRANAIFPKVYYDKILWRKLFDHEPIFVEMTDKLTARKIALDRAPQVKVTDILWEGESIDEFPIDEIEKPCIVKFNTGSGWYFIVNDATPETKSRLTETMHGFARQRYFDPESGEWSYLGIENRLFAERLLLDEEGRSPDDYKMFFSNGELSQVRVIHDRWENPALLQYHSDLRPIEIEEKGWHRNYEPRDWDMIDRILEVGRQLAGDMDFVRIDVFVHNREIYFSEFTLYPSSGSKRSIEIDPLRGEKWDIRKSYFFRGKLSLFKRIYLSCLNHVYRDSISEIPLK